MSVHDLPTIPCPGADEHAPWAGTYIADADRALAAAGTGDIVALLDRQPAQFAALLDGLGDDAAHRAYAPGKWTLAESLLHVADSERVFAYRLLRIARGDATPLPGFDQDAWVPLSGAARHTLASLLHELQVVRAATLSLVRALDTEALARSGTASGHPVSARALVWMIAGHAAHHLELTRTAYLGLPA
jgi:uncharacterized damage-inducible protein DinB